MPTRSQVLNALDATLSDSLSQPPGEALVFEARVPKFGMDELVVEVANGTLVLRANRQEDGPQGRVIRSFLRSIDLPRDADEGNVEAVLADGVLTITVPRRRPQLPRRVLITGTDPPANDGRAEWGGREFGDDDEQIDTRPKVRMPRAPISHRRLRLDSMPPTAPLGKPTFWGEVVAGLRLAAIEIDALLDRIVMSGSGS
jgi:hypothetical protein